MISVIIPCYNSEQYIDECIASVFAQNYSDYEIICVNDGSTDSTLSLLEKWSVLYPSKIRIFTTENQGAGKARNLGLKNALGDYIQFLDADDVLVSNKFLVQQQMLEQHKEFDLVVSDREDRSSNLKLVLQKHTFNSIQENFLERAIVSIIITGNPLYKTSIVRKVGGYDAELGSAQDWDFHIRLVLIGAKVAYAPGVFYYNRKLGNSVSSNWIKVGKNMAKILNRYKKQIQSHPNFNLTIRNYIFQIYYNAAVFSTNKEECTVYLEELKCWDSQNEFYLSLSSIKKLIFRLFGLRMLVYIDKKRQAI